LITVDLERDYTESDIVSTVKRPVFACHVRLVKDIEDRFPVNFDFDAESLMPNACSSLLVLLLRLHALHKKRGFVEVEEFEESTVVDPGTIVSSEGLIIRRSGEYYERIGRFDFEVTKNYMQRRTLQEHTEHSRTNVCLI
jgi:hypothetical protein